MVGAILTESQQTAVSLLVLAMLALFVWACLTEGGPE